MSFSSSLAVFYASAWNSDTVSVLRRERLWVVVDLKRRYRNSLNEWMNYRGPRVSLSSFMFHSRGPSRSIITGSSDVILRTVRVWCLVDNLRYMHVGLFRLLRRSTFYRLGSRLRSSFYFTAEYMWYLFKLTWLYLILGTKLLQFIWFGNILCDHNSLLSSELSLLVVRLPPE